MSNKAIFIFLIILAIALLVDFWYVTNVIAVREVGNLFAIGLISLSVIGTNAIIYTQIKHEKKGGAKIYLGLLVMDVLVLMFSINIFFASYDKLFHYTLLSVFSNILMLIGVIDNISYTPDKKTDFHMHIHDADSPIPSNMIIPVWLMIFFAYGFMVFLLSNTLISYPMFSTIGDWKGAFPNSFGVSEWENIAYVVFVFALTEWILKRGLKLEGKGPIAIAMLVSVASFILFHNLQYGLDVSGQISTAIFGFLGISLYKLMKSIVCSLSPMHTSNNFFGTIFKKTIFSQSVIGGTAGSILSVFIPIILFIIIISLLWYLKRKKRK